MRAPWLNSMRNDGRRPIMSDYDYRNPEDPFRRDAAYDPNRPQRQLGVGLGRGRGVRGHCPRGRVRHGPSAWAERNQYCNQRDAAARDANGAAHVDNPGADNYTGADQSNASRIRRRPINRQGSSSGSFAQLMQCGSGVCAGAVFYGQHSIRTPDRSARDSHSPSDWFRSPCQQPP